MAAQVLRYVLLVLFLVTTLTNKRKGRKRGYISHTARVPRSVRWCFSTSRRKDRTAVGYERGRLEARGTHTSAAESTTLNPRVCSRSKKTPHACVEIFVYVRKRRGFSSTTLAAQGLHTTPVPSPKKAYTHTNEVNLTWRRW